MGAQLWYHSAPWFPDPNDALLALQTQFLNEKYDLPSLLQNELTATRESVRLNEAQGDPYELLAMYRRKLALLEEVSRQGLPEDVRQRIVLVRKMHMDTGEGVGNVLDVTSTSTERGYLVAEVLTPEERGRLAGSERQTEQQAAAAVYRINEELGRGECVCFPLFADGTAPEPIGWYFVGNTID